MAKLSLKAGTTSKSVGILIQDSTKSDGTGLSGLAYNTSNLIAYWYQPGVSAPAAITLATLSSTTAAYSSGGFKEEDATNMKGHYRLDVPNAVLTGATTAIVELSGATNMSPCRLEIELTATDNQDAVHGGMSALPNTACTTNGSLITSGTGTAQLQVASGLAGLTSTSRGLIWDELLTGATHNITNSAGKILRSITPGADSVIYPPTGTVTLTSATSTTATLDGSASAVSQAYQWDVLNILTGTGAGQSRIIPSYSTGRVATVSPAWTTTPDNTSTFDITPTASVNIVSYASGQDPASMVLITAANKLYTDSSGRARLATDGLDSIATTAPSGVASTFPQMVIQVWRRFFKKTAKAVSGLTIKTYADDGTTVVTTQPYTDDGVGNETQGAAS